MTSDIIEQTDDLYYPCNDGIHICECNEVKNQFITLHNAHYSRPDVKRIFNELKVEFEEKNEAAKDLVVDMMVDYSIEDDFCISRQMLARLIEALPTPPKKED